MTIPFRVGLAAPAVLAALLMLNDNTTSSAQTASSSGLSTSTLGAALATTRSTGAATVAVLTSPDQPGSVRLWEQLNEGAWARTNRGLVQIVNISTATEPGVIRQMGVTRF